MKKFVKKGGGWHFFKQILGNLQISIARRDENTQLDGILEKIKFCILNTASTTFSIKRKIVLFHYSPFLSNSFFLFMSDVSSWCLEYRALILCLTKSVSVCSFMVYADVALMLLELYFWAIFFPFLITSHENLHVKFHFLLHILYLVKKVH